MTFNTDSRCGYRYTEDFQNYLSMGRLSFIYVAHIDENSQKKYRSDNDEWNKLKNMVSAAEVDFVASRGSIRINYQIAYIFRWIGEWKRILSFRRDPG